MAKIHVTTTINGEPEEFLCDPGESMLHVLRNQLNLTGSKEGCATGDCGACSITLDGTLVCACLMLGAEAEGREIETIEGMADGDRLHPLQEKFLDMAALPVRHLHARLPGRGRRRCWRKTRTRPRPRSVTGSPATSAGARGL